MGQGFRVVSWLKKKAKRLIGKKKKSYQVASGSVERKIIGEVG